jgi:hypothetical protein
VNLLRANPEPPYGVFPMLINQTLSGFPQPRVYYRDVNPILVHLGKQVEGNAEWWALYGAVGLLFKGFKKLLGQATIAPSKKTPLSPGFPQFVPLSKKTVWT